MDINVIYNEDIIRKREEISEQVAALKAFKKMCANYGFDVSKPAQNAKEAVQWTYFGYLGAVKDQDGAAMSLGRVSSFLDIFIEKDIAEGTLTEEEAQELVDQMIIKMIEASENNVIGTYKNGVFVCVVPGNMEVDLKKAAKVSGNKNCDMIAMKELLATTGYIRGGCSPIGMKKPYPIYIHQTMELYDVVYVSAGQRGLQIKISGKALINYTCATVCDIAI